MIAENLRRRFLSCPYTNISLHRFTVWVRREDRSSHSDTTRTGVAPFTYSEFMGKSPRPVMRKPFPHINMGKHLHKSRNPGGMTSEPGQLPLDIRQD